ncbi:hypothetical protein PHYSODRAFT_285738 [Phytophthora sojae]|uniref:ATP-dependent DNA helicase n=1 Tax=Phytophthora sojae (strain P6497) TaxID=1094619 RepID=G4Z7V4_PHYSP|nr:hypothetical protein PHYSODRAFT_285738 [Phytophthora sojae]EGZ22489.1 hypothetical protein PHYSODRAFT_285738 [Phytophthora sojae]|eukprot:XP_009525206.1 hypothetical protein PHYSODRAFT_285738 [Phytophthora sojae]
MGQRSLPPLQMKSEFGKVVLVIVDEISMTDQALLGSFDLASRAMSDNPQKLVGGKRVLLCGDWLQLPAVRGTPCKFKLLQHIFTFSFLILLIFLRYVGFTPPDETASRYHHAGFNLYNTINFVVFLTENMRADDDDLYARILADLRWGRVSEDNLASLNSRVKKAPATITASTTFFRPLVVSTNNLRCAINKVMTFKISADTGSYLYEFPAEPSNRSQHIFKHIIDANEDLTQRIPMRLYSFVGMPVMITRKLPVLKNMGVVANGTLGTVIGFYPPIESRSCVDVESDEPTVIQLASPPELLLIRLHDCNTVLVDDFAPGVIGVPRISSNIKLKNMPNFAQASITIKQFPVVPAFACTTEKSRGKLAPMASLSPRFTDQVACLHSHCMWLSRERRPLIHLH